MAENRDTFVSEIYVNNEQANDAIAEMTKQLTKLTDKYDDLAAKNEKLADKTAKAKAAMDETRKSLEGMAKDTDEYAKTSKKLKDQEKAYNDLAKKLEISKHKTDDAKREMNSMEESLKRTKDGVKRFGDAMNDLSGRSMENLLRMQKQLKAEMDKTKPNTTEWNDLAKKYQDVAKRIKDLGEVQNSVTTGTGKLKNGMGGLLGKLGNISSMITAIPTMLKGARIGIKAITEVTRQTIQASQTLSDKWNNGMAAMKTTTEAFFFSLSTGDWSAFNDGITGALKKARELAELMDLMGSYDISNMYMQTEYETAFREALADYNDPSKTEKEREEALGKAEKALTDYKGFLEGWGDDTRKTLIEAFDVRGIDYTAALDEENEDAQAAFDHFFDELYKNVIIGKNKVVNELNDLNEDVRKKGIWATLAAAFPSSASQETIDNFTEATQNLAEATQAATEEERNLRLASQLNDETLTGLIQTYQKQREATRKATRMQNTYNNALKGGTTNTKNNTNATDAYTEAIKKVDKAEAAQLTTLKQLYAAGLMDKQAYEAQKALIEEDYLKQRLATAEQYGKDTDQFMNQLLDRQIARMEKAKAMLKEEADEMAKYYAGLQTKDEARFLNKSDNGIADQEAYDAFQEKIWQKAAEIRAAITEDSARTEYETEVMWAQKLAEQKKITAEEAERYILQAKLKYAQAAAQQVSQITEQASNFVAALKEAESAQLEAEYQRQLTAAGDNAEERERIEAEHEQKKLDLQKKYADVEMAVNIAKTIANGAGAAIRAWLDAGPFAGPVLAAVIAATTAAEIATIVAQRNAIKSMSVSAGSTTAGTTGAKTGERKITGYAEGGYTGKGLGTMGVTERPARPKKRHRGWRTGDDEEVGVVHANEWVAPAWMVRQNPVMFANLEQYRQRGYAEGGYTGKGLGTMGVTERPARPPKRGPSTGSGTAGSGDGGIETIVRVAVREELPSALKALRVVLVRRDLTELDAQTEKFEEQTSR